MGNQEPQFCSSWCEVCKYLDRRYFAGIGIRRRAIQYISSILNLIPQKNRSGKSLAKIIHLAIFTMVRCIRSALPLLAWFLASLCWRATPGPLLDSSIFSYSLVFDEKYLHVITLVIHEIDHYAITKPVSWNHGTFEIRTTNSIDSVNGRVRICIMDRLPVLTLLALYERRVSKTLPVSEVYTQNWITIQSLHGITIQAT